MSKKIFISRVKDPCIPKNDIDPFRMRIQVSDPVYRYLAKCRKDTGKSLGEIIEDLFYFFKNTEAVKSYDDSKKPNQDEVVIPVYPRLIDRTIVTENSEIVKYFSKYPRGAGKLVEQLLLYYFTEKYPKDINL